MARVLGCSSDYEVIVNDRCGAPEVVRLTDYIERLEYGRLLDGTSECVVTLNTGCCDKLNRIAPLRHTLMVLRDGEIAWEGLLLIKEEGGTRLTRSGRESTAQDKVGIDVATIHGFDFTTWLDVRAVREPYDKTVDPIEYLETIIRAGLAPDDPCLLEHLEFVYGITPQAIKIGAYDATVGQELRRFASEGVDFTAIGRRIVVFPAQHILGDIGVLRDDHFLTVPLITDQGGDYTSRVIVKANGITRAAGFVDEYYGLVERISENDRVTTGASAFQSAKERLGYQGGIVPRYIVLEDDTFLAPTAPVELSDLWPGVRLDVALAERCQVVQQSFKLSGVSVTVDEEGERVALTTIPLGEAVVEGDDTGLPDGSDIIYTDPIVP